MLIYAGFANEGENMLLFRLWLKKFLKKAYDDCFAQVCLFSKSEFGFLLQLALQRPYDFCFARTRDHLVAELSQRVDD